MFKEGRGKEDGKEVYDKDIKNEDVKKMARNDIMRIKRDERKVVKDFKKSEKLRVIIYKDFKNEE